MLVFIGIQSTTDFRLRLWILYKRVQSLHMCSMYDRENIEIFGGINLMFYTLSGSFIFYYTSLVSYT